MSLIPYDLYLLYDKDCHQCKYMIEKIKSLNYLDYIKMIEKDTYDFDRFKMSYSIEQVPTMIVLLGNRLIVRKVLNKKEDLEYIINNYI